jgi:cystine transport system ATP-binding protein
MADNNVMIKVENLHKVFGSSLHVLKGLNLEVKKGEVITVLGPSGSGKSTMLRCINFLEEPTAGTITVDGTRLNAGERGSQRRADILKVRKKAGMCFQSFNLFPHMTAIENIIEGPVTVLGQSKKNPSPTRRNY